MIDLVPGNLIDVDEYERAAKGDQPPPRNCIRCGVEMMPAWEPVPCPDCWSNEVERWLSYGYVDAHRRARESLRARW